MNKNNVSQSVETPSIILQVVAENRLTDRLPVINKVYKSVRDQAGYSDALFIQTLLKSATLKEAANKQKSNIGFERYIRKAILNNIRELTTTLEIEREGIKPYRIIEDKLPASVQKQLKREKELDVLGNTYLLDEKKKLKDYPELQQMLDQLRRNSKHSPQSE